MTLTDLIDWIPGDCLYQTTLQFRCYSRKWYVWKKGGSAESPLTPLVASFQKCSTEMFSSNHVPLQLPPWKVY